jgi:hypothetical protein
MWIYSAPLLMPSPANDTGIDTADSHVDFPGDIALLNFLFGADQAVVIRPDIVVKFIGIEINRQKFPF